MFVVLERGVTNYAAFSEIKTDMEREEWESSLVFLVSLEFMTYSS